MEGVDNLKREIYGRVQIFIADLFNMLQKQYIVHIKGKHPNLNWIEIANMEWQ